MTRIDGAIETTFAEQTLALLPDRAVWWPGRSTLIVADVHLGKSASFRTVGVPVPSGATAKDLSRLTLLIQQTAAQRLVILGDLVHSRRGRQVELVEAVARWRRSHSSLAITLIRGNHDRGSGFVPADWAIEEVDEPFGDGPIMLAHDPEAVADRPVLAGHVHPVASLTDFDGSRVRAPCFVFDQDLGILPSFGTFTGGHAMMPRPGRQLYLVAGARIVSLNARNAR